MTNHKVRSSILDTNEVYVNINDLIIKIMEDMCDVSLSPEERRTLQRVVDYLVVKRDKSHSS